ncbi:MAG: glycosyltransferase family 4 protein [Actinomycetes bacterium]|jgi:phosphatidylinositol alpha-mannosyltransferase
MKKMRIGLVSPYDWSVPGGVQFHIRDLAVRLIDKGHFVSVLTPDSGDEPRPGFIVGAGRSIPVPYNGAIARLAFGPLANARVRKWISENDFDLLHLHEPAIPSLSILACWAASGPMVGTFHAAYPQSWAMNVAAPILEPAMDKLSARIAVSEAAHSSLVEHLGGDAVVIPNGVDTAPFARAHVNADWSHRTIGFLGRFEEARKGFDLLVAAFAALRARGEIADVRILVAGRGDSEEVLEKISKTYGVELASKIHFLGEVSDGEKADFLKSVSLYVAPNTGGESFGIIIAEAMASGAAILASNLPPFVNVLEDAAEYFENEDVADLANKIGKLMGDESLREHYRSAGLIRAPIFDWDEIVPKILSIYEMITADGQRVVESTTKRRRGE